MIWMTVETDCQSAIFFYLFNYSTMNTYPELRFHLRLIPLAALCLLPMQQGIAQDENPTTDTPLMVLGDFPFTPKDYTEENKNYNTKTTDAKTVTLSGTGSSYSGKNVNITNNYTGTENSYGIFSEKGKYIHFGADEGTYSTVTTSADSKSATGIRITSSLTEQSYIYNTKVYNKGTWGHGMEAFSSVLLNNVHFYLEPTNAEGAQAGYGIYANGQKSLVTNKNESGEVIGTVTVTASADTNATAAVASYMKAVVDLAEITIDINHGGALAGGGGGMLTLTNSTIISRNEGNTLITSTSWDSPVFTLNNVKIRASEAPDSGIAKDQRIYVKDSLGDTISVNLINTDFDGYTELKSPLSTQMPDCIQMTLSSNASWTVSRDSDLGLNGSLTLDGSSTISFTSAEDGDFTNINSAVVMLANGSILQLDKDSSEFSGGDIITLFTKAEGENYTNNGALLVTSDDKILEYIDLDNGKFELTGNIIDPIPEPSSSVLGLAGMAALAFARKRRK